ncbi:acyl carrier protein [Micromonospora sp. NPDC048170]|uniref:acyl carrier protein n=1 Tax=Micromonospora sp. NPDC048170 TaxID=3154819 RepID=UPI003404E3A4
MGVPELTLEDLKRILRVAGGEDDPETLDGDILDVSFADLGYDSLAMLETVSRIEREFGTSLPDELVPDMPTPRVALDTINSRLRAAA